MRKILPILLSLGFLGIAPKVEASCTVSVAPNNVIMGNSSKSIFQITNTGEEMGNWVRIVSRDQNAYTIAQMNASGWYPNGGGTEANFAGGYLEGGSSSEFSLALAETGEVISSMNWEAMLSHDGGESFESCGSATIQIIPAPAPPKISGVSLTVGNSSAVIKFETSLTAEGNILYGVSSEYGGRVSSSAGTSHTITLANLASSTTYHYKIQATSEGGTTSTVDAAFSTSEVNVTTTTTTTTLTNTVTSTVTNVNTVKQVILDTTAPVLKLSPLVGATQKVGSKAETRIYDAAPLLEGSVVDDRGVARVEYRVVERESSWSEANLDEAVGTKKMNWDFLPPLSLDGSYVIEVRAVDVFGNVSPVKKVEFVIDQLLPTIVGGVVSYGAMPLEVKNGEVDVIAGLEYEIVLYETGGADKVKLKALSSEWELTKTGMEGIWRGVVKMPKVLTENKTELLVEAEDGAGNITKRTWIMLKILPLGHILRNGKEARIESLKIYQLDPTTKDYEEWDHREYWPQSWEGSRQMNELNLMLPAGTYYLDVILQSDKKWPREQAVSQKIIVEKSVSLIVANWEIGDFEWWQRFWHVKKFVEIPWQQIDEGSVSLRPSPEGDRTSWIGKRSVVFLGIEGLPWYEQGLYQASEWAKSEKAQLVIGKLDKSSEHGLLPLLYLVDQKGDTIDYKEGNWKR